MQSTPAAATPSSISAPTPNPNLPDTHDQIKTLMKEFTVSGYIQNLIPSFSFVKEHADWWQIKN